MEQVNTFIYLQNLVSYEKDKSVDNKITKFLKTTGRITFKANKLTLAKDCM
jgi:hypothetical protein